MKTEAEIVQWLNPSMTFKVQVRESITHMQIGYERGGVVIPGVIMINPQSHKTSWFVLGISCGILIGLVLCFQDMETHMDTGRRRKLKQQIKENACL